MTGFRSGKYLVVQLQRWLEPVFTDSGSHFATLSQIPKGILIIFPLYRYPYMERTCAVSELLIGTYYALYIEISHTVICATYKIAVRRMHDSSGPFSIADSAFLLYCHLLFFSSRLPSLFPIRPRWVVLKLSSNFSPKPKNRSIDEWPKSIVPVSITH